MFDWIITAVLGNMPIWIWPAVAGAGFTIYLLAGILIHIPEIKPYAMFVKPVGAIACVIGIFMYGGAGVTAIYQAQIKDMQNKVAMAEQKSNDANALLSEKVTNNTKIIHDKQVVYKDRIKEVEKIIDNDCKVDLQMTKILNSAATNPIKSSSVTVGPATIQGK